MAIGFVRQLALQTESTRLIPERTMTAKPTVTTAAQRAQNTTRQKVLDAIIQCVNRWGVTKTSLNDIAREAGVTRKTVYSYFPSREEALKAGVLQLGINYGQRLLVHLQGFEEVEERYCQCVLFAIEELSKEPFSSVLQEPALRQTLRDSLRHEEGWQLVNYMMDQVFGASKLPQDDVQAIAEAAVRLVLSYLTISEREQVSVQIRERIIRGCCLGILREFAQT